MRLFYRLCNSLKKGKPNSFVVMKAGKEDKGEVLRLMMDVFFKTDPSSVYSKVAEDTSPSPVLQETCVDSLEEGLSFIARDKESDKSAVGVALNGIRPTTLLPSHMDTTLKRVKAKSERTLLELWTFVSTMPPDAEKFFEGEKQVFEVRYLVVDPQRRNRGIATALVNRSIKEAADKGYRFIRIDCTSHFTARIASAFGMNCIYEMKYLDYKNSDGQKVFQNVVTPHTEILVYAGKSSRR